MILSLHRRYPEGEHWEIDPNQMGSIIIEAGNVRLEMHDTPIKFQIEKVLAKPITYIEGLFSDMADSAALKTVDKNSDEYTDALVSELRRIGIEARRRQPALV